MLALEWRKAAHADLRAIAAHIAENNPDAAHRLVDEIENRAEALREYPRRFREGRVPGTREMVVRRNFIVVYAENTRSVIILRVLHAAQQWPSA